MREIIKSKYCRCQRADYCVCSPLDTEPNDKCPIHGAKEWPPKCYQCGKIIGYRYKVNNFLPF